MKWFRKQTAPAGASVQLRETGHHPFGLLGQYVPMRSGEIRLYRAVREAVPVVDAASGRVYGTITSVTHPAAQDIYTVRDENGAETLFPAVKPFLKQVDLENGRVLENTFSAGAKIEPVRVERRPYQFTYEDDLGAHFMHTETFEEINIDKNLIDNYDLMADGQIVEVMFHTEKESVLSAELPPIVDMEVTYTEPGIKGDTASTNSLKPATVNTGATIKVPLFINTGDKIRVDTRTREYYERIK